MAGSRRQYRFAPVWFIVCAGTCLTVVATLTLWQWEMRSQRTRFHIHLNTLRTSLQQRIDSSLDALQATSGLYDASSDVSNREFRTFIDRFITSRSGILGFSWVPRIRQAQRAVYEQQLKASGISDLGITDRNAKGQPTIAPLRPEYFPVTYVEPIDLNRSALSFDLGSEPLRRAAVERSRDTGNIAVTQRIATVTTGQTGFLAFSPIYRPDSNVESVQARRDNFVGTVSVVIQVSNIVESALSTITLENVDFYVLDKEASPEHQFLAEYRSADQKVLADLRSSSEFSFEDASFCDNQTRCTRTIQVGDRQWLLMARPNVSYHSWQYHLGSLAAFGLGSVLTAVLAIYTRVSIRHTLQVERLVRQRTIQAERLRNTVTELKSTQAQLIQTEKMSSLGQLVAGVAHEINNPVNFIHGNLNHASEYVQDLIELIRLYQYHYPVPNPEITAQAEKIDLEFLTEDLCKILTSMKSGTDRIRQIVLSLRNFSRMDEAEFKAVDLHEGLDNTLLILQNNLKAKHNRPAIEVIKAYGDLPPVECYAGQLNQVFMNILSNAIDALDEQAQSMPLICDLNCAESTAPSGPMASPTITIRTGLITAEDNSHTAGDRVLISITDNGSGITEEIKNRLFDPFFTTKPVGQGTGLGLSISYQIVVQKHKGSLTCKSEPGKGTEFRIEIPLHQTRAITHIGGSADTASAA